MYSLFDRVNGSCRPQPVQPWASWSSNSAHTSASRPSKFCRARSAVEGILALGGTAVICTEDEDLRERVAEIAGRDGVFKAIDCVSGQVGADVSRALAPSGELVVYGALSTHRQTDPAKLTIPVFARSLIYETKTVRGFWLFRWLTETPKDRVAATIERTVQLADSGALRVPEGQPIPVEKFSEAVHLAEAPEHGGKPLLVFDPQQAPT